MVIDHLHNETLRILGLDAGDRIDPDKPLMDLGLDSLMAVEMRNALSSAIGQNLPATLLFDYPTLETICSFLLALIGLLPDTQATPPAPESGADENQTSTDDLLRWIETMPDDEIDRRMNKKD
jgi:acyl carrier protein